MRISRNHPVHALKPLLTLILIFAGVEDAKAQEEPVRIAVAGLVHGHVGWILNRPVRPDLEMVAIIEHDTALAQRFAERYGFDMGIVYDSMEEMDAEVEVDAVAVFSSTLDHLELTQDAARLGLHVMLEKPMAVSLDHARRMQAAGDSAGIHLLINYETSWYESVHFAHVARSDLGPLRKIVVRNGHQGPQEIGVGPEFLKWLTDPVANGAGALMDFGCYGANLITWLMDGARPTSVTAVVQTLKPSVYPDVDDEATIVVTFPEVQGIIQASWNWPFNRKDLSLYGTEGYLHADNATDVRMRLRGDAAEQSLVAADLAPSTDPFSYLAGVVRGRIDPAGGLYSVAINLTAMEILEAALESAREGRTVYLSDS